jgi:hypothetical protein
MAELIRRIPDDVVVSFALANAEERVAQLTQITNKISYGMLPIVGWVERRRHPETAELIKRRLLFVLNEAVECAAYDIPEYAGGAIHECAIRGKERRPSDGARRTATLVVSATTVADLLRGWADDIEAEDMQRDSSGGQATGNAAQGDSPASSPWHAAGDTPPDDDAEQQLWSLFLSKQEWRGILKDDDATNPMSITTFRRRIMGLFKDDIRSKPKTHQIAIRLSRLTPIQLERLRTEKGMPESPPDK